jgi:hypothetical protein
VIVEATPLACSARTLATGDGAERRWFGLLRQRIAVLAPAIVMEFAPPAGVMLVVASFDGTATRAYGTVVEPVEL